MDDDLNPFFFFGGNGFIKAVQDWTVTFGSLLYGVFIQVSVSWRQCVGVQRVCKALSSWICI